MVGDGIARASGLVNCMAGELLEFEDGSCWYGAESGRKQRVHRIVRFR